MAMQQHFPQLVGGAWQFAEDIRTKFCIDDYTNGGPGSVEAAKLASMVDCWAQITVLSELKCCWCGGYGHAKSDCNTSRAITNCSRGSVTARSGVALARNDAVVLRAAHRANNAQIPRNAGAGAYMGSRKRDRKRGGKGQGKLNSFGFGF